VLECQIGEPVRVCGKHGVIDQHQGVGTVFRHGSEGRVERPRVTRFDGQQVASQRLRLRRRCALDHLGGEGRKPVGLELGIVAGASSALARLTANSE
jgi:hypothetical protein